MGQQLSCCIPAEPDPSDEKVIYSEDVSQQNIASEKYLIRNGLPSKNIGINVYKLRKMIKNVKDWEKMQDTIFEIVDQEKKKKKAPVEVNRHPIAENKLEEPYYLVYQQAFYIGQWAFDSNFNANVPYGIGKLYQKGAISEGVFQTFKMDETQLTQLENILKNEILQRQSTMMKYEAPILEKDQGEEEENKMNKEHVQDIQQEIRSIEKQKFHNKEREENLVKTKIEDPKAKSKQKTKSKVLRRKSTIVSKESKMQLMRKSSEISGSLMTSGQIEPEKILIKLNGMGRIYNKDLSMQGKFLRGLLNGKGKLSIPKQEYEYAGYWKQGVKYGKGKQTTRQTEYQGYFENDMKNGRGILLFIGSAKKKNARQAEQDSYNKKMKEQGEQIKKRTQKNIKIRKSVEKLLKKALKQFPLSIAVDMHSIAFDTHLVIERQNKKLFLEEYSGDFLNNKMHGRGNYIWPNGKSYSGMWQNGVMSGKGEFVWPDGSFYQGEYQNDERHGEGIMVWNIYRRYRGNWAFGLRHGYGEAIQLDESENLTIKGAVWDQDKIKIKKFEKTIKLEGFNKLISRYQQQ